VYQMKDRLYLYFFIGLVTISLVTVGTDPRFVAAQSPNQWSPQKRIHDIYAQEKQLVLVADQNRTVHAFNSQEIEGIEAIVYLQWTLEQQWTTPIDIFISSNSIQIMDAFLDQAGVMHIAIEMGGDIYYSRAMAINAGQASAWSTPKKIGEQAQYPFNAALVGDNKSNVVLIYSGWHNGNGIYVVNSIDGSNTWSDPDPIFLTYDDKVVAVDTQAILDQSGQLHAVWSTVNESGHGEGGYYASLDVERGRWSEPLDLDVTEGLGIRFPSLVEYDGEIFVGYYNGRANTNWWRRSNDGGQTWSEPVRVSPRHVGTNGPISFVVDNNNILHMFFGQRINDLNHGMWHSVWNGYGWPDPEAVVSGPFSQVPGEEFDPTTASAVVSQGNVILVTWTTDAQIFVDDVWYSYIILDAPELPVVALPTPTVPTPAPVPTVTPSLAEPTPSPTRPVLANYQSFDSSKGAINPATPIIVGTVPVVLLISAFIVVHRLQQRERR
jgi:hypothetical protein